jgi:PqqD family protein of HPr-rel-A system
VARYRADPPAMRPCVVAEGMTLLFHRPSGATHVLLPPAPEILDMLAEEAADAETLTRRIAAEFLVEASDEPIAEVVAARLAELEAAGLVSRA